MSDLVEAIGNAGTDSRKAQVGGFEARIVAVLQSKKLSNANAMLGCVWVYLNPSGCSSPVWTLHMELQRYVNGEFKTAWYANMAGPLQRWKTASHLDVVPACRSVSRDARIFHFVSILLLIPHLN